MPVNHQVGDSIGHYQIVQEIGIGGNGRVLQVEHLITRRREAMKILIGGKPSSQEYAHRFLREIRLQASLDHPNIAAVLNAFWLEEDLVMVMELIHGQTLQKVVERRKPTLDQSLAIIRQVLEALAYAHLNGVVHRDVSTANIIVSEGGRIKLTDFGLAKGPSDPTLTDQGGLAGMSGSPYYISPEQVRGNSSTDQRSDIYSTGVVLYELLTGTRPFEGASNFLLMQAHVQQSPQAPIARNAAIPEFISNAILKAMAKDPWDRFQSATEFLDSIDGPSGISLPLPEIEQPFRNPVGVEKPSRVLLKNPIASSANPETINPAQYTHSYAAPLPPEDAPPAVKAPPKVKPKVSLARRIWASPVVGAAMGIGAVVAAVAPVVLYDFELGRPRFAMPASMPEIRVPAPALPSDVNPKHLPTLQVLTPGPKVLPTLSDPSTAPAHRPTYSQRPAVTAVSAQQPPPIVVWGQAELPKTAQQKAPAPAPAPVAAPQSRIEEPPVLPSAKPVAVIAPNAVPPSLVPPRKGILGRFAKGVRSLNLMRKENGATSPSGAVSPAAGGAQSGSVDKP